MNPKIVTSFHQKIRSFGLKKNQVFQKIKLANIHLNDSKNNEKKKGSLPVFTVVWNQANTFSFKVSVQFVDPSLTVVFVTPSVYT